MYIMTNQTFAFSTGSMSSLVGLMRQWSSFSSSDIKVGLGTSSSLHRVVTRLRAALCTLTEGGEGPRASVTTRLSSLLSRVSEHWSIVEMREILLLKWNLSYIMWSQLNSETFDRETFLQIGRKQDLIRGKNFCRMLNCIHVHVGGYHIL